MIFIIYFPNDYNKINSEQFKSISTIFISKANDLIQDKEYIIIMLIKF